MTHLTFVKTEAAYVRVGRNRRLELSLPAVIGLDCLVDRLDRLQELKKRDSSGSNVRKTA